MATYQLLIVTPTGKAFDDKVVSLTAPGALGLFGVLANHAPMLTSLKNGVLQLKQETGEKFFSLGPGVLEVNPKHNVLILADSAAEARSMEEAKEKIGKPENS